jgi:hypothetical protein
MVQLMMQLAIKPADRPSGSGNKPKFVLPGEYVVGMSCVLNACTAPVLATRPKM